MRKAGLWLLAASCAVGGCRRRSTQPSAEYERAAGLYQQLYATRLDDAYGDPRMDAVVADLQKVDGRSADADAARSLLGTIERGRAQLARQRQESDELAAQLRAPAPVSIDPSAVLAASRRDAGVEVDPTGTGAAIADLNQQYGGCLVADQRFHEEGTGKAGRIYKLAPFSGCREKLPGFIGQAVMVVDGFIYRRIPLAETQQAEASAADAGPGSRPPAAPAAAAAARPQPQIPPDAKLVKIDPDGTRHYETTTTLPPGTPPAAPPAAPNPDDVTPHPSADGSGPGT